MLVVSTTHMMMGSLLARVGDYNTPRVLIDNESSANFLYYSAFQLMRIEREQLISTNASLVGFGGTRVYPLDTITLPVTVGDYPQQITKDVTFLIDCSSTYNAILGRPTLNSWKAVTSTYQIPTEYRVREVHGDQVAAHECYMSKEEQQMVVGPIEGLEEILLDNSRPKRTTRIGTLASPSIRQAFITFLK